MLRDDLFPLELGEALQAHVQDRLGLDLGEGEPGHEGVAGRLHARRSPDEPDHQVQALDRLPEPLQDVGPLFGAGEVVARPPDDHLPPEIDEVVEHLPQRHHLGAAVDEGEHDDAEGRLHGRVLVELVEDDLRDFPLAQLQHDADPVPVRLVPDLGETVELPFTAELGDLGDQRGLVDLVREFGDDDRLAPAPELLGVGPRAHGDDAPSRRVGFADPGGAVDVAAGREVRTLDDREQFPRRRLRVVEDLGEAVDDFTEVVRRDVRGHPDGDPGRAVDEEVGEPGRQHRGLLFGLVVVRYEIDRVAVDVGQHLPGDAGQARFGVAHGRRGVAVDGAEVPLGVDQGVAQVEVLGHPHQRLVDRRVAVRVEVLHGLAHDARALAVARGRAEAHLLHRVEHAAVDRLEPVANVGQRPPDDDGHGVVEVGPPHLVFDGDRLLALRHRELPPGCRRNPGTSRSVRRGGRYTSMVASSAWVAMNSRRGSTWSPISLVKILSAPTASSMVTRRSVRVSGFMVVSHSCSGFISPSPL